MPSTRRRTSGLDETEAGDTTTTAVSDPIRGTSEPGRHWASTNVGEAVPEVMSSMCRSVREEPKELAVFDVRVRGRLILHVVPCPC
jgi:hypothetical protein